MKSIALVLSIIVLVSGLSGCTNRWGRRWGHCLRLCGVDDGS
jgi:hypothetical protein